MRVCMFVKHCYKFAVFFSSFPWIENNNNIGGNNRSSNSKHVNILTTMSNNDKHNAQQNIYSNKRASGRIRYGKKVSRSNDILTKQKQKQNKKNETRTKRTAEYTISE